MSTRCCYIPSKHLVSPDLVLLPVAHPTAEFARSHYHKASFRDNDEGIYTPSRRGERAAAHGEHVPVVHVPNPIQQHLGVLQESGSVILDRYLAELLLLRTLHRRFSVLDTARSQSLSHAIGCTYYHFVA